MILKNSSPSSLSEHRTSPRRSLESASLHGTDSEDGDGPSPHLIVPSARERPSAHDEDFAHGSKKIIDDGSHNVLASPPLAAGSISQEEAPTHSTPTKPVTDDSSASVTWRSLPRKDQLTILTLTRLAEPLCQTSLQAYMFFMLKSFDPTLSDSQVASQAGWLTGSFTAVQCLTAVWWGRLADKEWMGRKNVLLIGLLGTFVSQIGFGFSRSFWVAMAFRMLGGGLNGNVGVMRTMISEIIKEKKFQPKAFLILPVTFNVGVLLGPVLGGWLQNPVELYPNVFGPGSKLGGDNGVQWMVDYPYAFPNLLIGVVFVFCILLVILGLEETHIERSLRPDPYLDFGRWLGRCVQRPFKRHSPHTYHSLADLEPTHEIELATHQPSRTSLSPTIPHARRPQLPYRRIFTRNVLFTFLAHALLHIHTAAFSTLWFLFLSTPRADSSTAQSLPFHFTGGLGLPPPTIGFAIGIIGGLGLCLQFGIYSRIVSWLGVVTTFRVALLCSFPLVYIFVPYLAVVPTRSTPPHPADGVAIWATIAALLFVQVVGRTFVLPITQILVNNCTPHPSVLGAVHGIGQSVSSGSRTLGPVIWSAIYGWGLRKGYVGIAWWVLAVEATIGAGASWLLREGSGHEIWLEGD